MRGLPLLIVFFALASFVVKTLRSIAEAQQNRNDEPVDDEAGGEWTEWKAARRAATPPPPPAPGVRRASPPPRPPSAARPAPAKHSFQDMIREARQAVKTTIEANRPQPNPPPPPAAAGERPETLAMAMDSSESISQALGEECAYDASAAFDICREGAASSLDTAFPGMPDLPSPTASSGRMAINIRGAADLRRAVILREILERPRAFDM